MGMIDRYRKSGGFLQLLQLIETCGPKKQIQFLEIIRNEEPAWALALEQRMLSIEKIFTWKDELIGEIFNQIQELTLAVALHGLTKEKQERALLTLSHSKKRKIMDYYESKAPNPAEISTAMTKIINEVRNLAAHGHLRLEKIDPLLKVEDNIEDKLQRGEIVSISSSSLLSSDNKGETSLAEDPGDVELEVEEEIEVEQGISNKKPVDSSDIKTAPNSLSTQENPHQQELLIQITKLNKSLLNSKTEYEKLLKENKLLKEKLLKIKSILETH